LRGDPLELGSRERGISATRLTPWRAACLDAGQEALKKPLLESPDRDRVRLRQKLGDATREMELLHEKLERLETSRP
jgi:ribosomal 50S subunit-associated protein YjgA (DUF615 family)